MKRFLALAIAAFLSLAFFPLTGNAQEKYPAKPIRIVVPFAPGGSDNIGAEAVAKSPADGYTLLMATTGVMAINNALFKSMSFDAAKDFEPVIFRVYGRMP